MKKAVDNICPRCGGDVPNTYMKGRYPGALSRYDNETEICSECGTSEAFAGFVPGYPTLPRDQWFDRQGAPR